MGGHRVESMILEPGGKRECALGFFDFSGPFDERFILPLFAEEAIPAHAFLSCENGNDVGDVARAKAARDSDLNISDQLAGLELSLEVINGYRWMALLCAATTAAITDKDLSVNEALGFQWIQHVIKPLGL